MYYLISKNDGKPVATVRPTMNAVFSIYIYIKFLSILPSCKPIKVINNIIN